MAEIETQFPVSTLQPEISSYHTILNKVLRANKQLPKNVSPRTLVVPQMFASIQAAVSAAKPSDTILVKSGHYHESVVIPTNKSSIRILADGSVTLNGRRRLSSAFTLHGNNIEIHGFTIRNYVKSGIQIVSVFGSRLIRNSIKHITLGNGIRMIAGSFGNLIWKNRVTKSRMDGIDMRGKNNYIVENEFSENHGRGVHLRALGNYVVQNRICDNGKEGITDRKGLNLIYKNEIVRNGTNGLHETSGFGGAVVAANRFTENRHNGLRLDTLASIILQNDVDHNKQSGIRLKGDQQVLKANTITDNQNDGVKISGRNNLLLRNHVRDNTPFDILNLHDSNTFIKNTCQSSQPPELCRTKISMHKILRVPQQFKTITAALEAATPGSTILVQNGIYKEAVTIPLAKSSIRFVAEGNKVILDGQGKRHAAFTTKANNVEIAGFTIRNYVNAGLLVGGIANKLIANDIQHIAKGNGITLNRAFSTLIWKNRITQANQHGVSILAMNTWCLDNEISQNGGHGILTTEITTVGNTLTDNRIFNNTQVGIHDNAGFNLIFNNHVSNNGLSGIRENSGTGYASILSNTVTQNHNFGLDLVNNGNFISQNTIRDNIPANIHNSGKFNVFEQNEDGERETR